MKKVLLALVKAVGFALLFLFAQALVMFIANIAFTVGLVMESYGPFGAVQPFDELLTAALDFTEKYGTLLTAGGDLLALCVVWAIFALRKKSLRAETDWKRIQPRTALLAIACGAAFSAAICIALSLLPIPETLMQGYEEASSGLLSVNSPLVLLAVVFIGPVAEEVFFRGLIYTRLRNAMPRAAAAVLSSLIFAVIHGDAIWMTYAFCAGLLMCAAFEQSGSLWASIAFHCAFNMMGSYVAGFIPDMTLALAGAVCVCFIAAGFLCLRGMRARTALPEGEAERENGDRA